MICDRDIKFNSDTHFLGGSGNMLCRKEFSLPAKAKVVTIRLTADPHSYARHSWLPLRGDGNDGNWLLGGSFVKFRLFLDGELLGLGPFRPLQDGVGVLHTFTIQNLSSGPHVVGVFSRGEKNGFALQLQAELINGETYFVNSNSSWQELPANDIYRPVCWDSPKIDNFFKGGPGPGEYPEHIDGRLFPDHWTTPEFAADGWRPARTHGKVPFALETVSWNYQWERRPPAIIRELSPNHYLLDFGREAIGGIELTGPEAGGTVEIRLAEELLNENQVLHQMRTGNCYQERWTFKPGSQRLSHFGLRIFRYAEIIDYNGTLTPERICQLAVHAPFNPASGKMSCSNQDLNRIWELCKYTIQATTMDLYTDCFSRERIAYEADSFINMRSHFAVEGNTAPARRTLEYLINHPTWPCEWKQLMIPLFYEYFMHTGDMQLLKKYFDQLVKQCSYLHLLHNGLVEKFPLEVIIDWPQSYRDDYDMAAPSPTVPNALVYYNLVLLSKISGYLNLPEQKTYFEKLAIQTAYTVNRELFDSDQGLYIDGLNSRHCSFHANLFALWSGVVPPGRVNNILNFLIGKGMVCSLYGAQFVLDVLFRYNRAEEALKLLLSRGNASWLNMIDAGATITPEVWQSNTDYPRSWAHPWGSSPTNIIVRNIFGLCPTQPGWREFEFKPQPGMLEHGELSMVTPHGVINALFHRGSNGEIHTSLSDQPFHNTRSSGTRTTTKNSPAIQAVIS